MVKIKFNNARYITSGISSEVDISLQLFMWQCISRMKVPKDYLQIFKCSNFEGQQEIEHIQEEPEYKKRYLLKADAFFIGKIYVIDNGQYTVMMLAEEY